MLRRLMRLAAWLAWTAVILRITLPFGDLQDHPHWGKVQWIPFVTPPIRLRDIIGNVVLYVPFGYAAARTLAPWIRARVLAVSLLAVLLSFAAETTQLYSHRRFPSSTDIVCNLVGGWCGAHLGYFAFRRLKPALVEEFIQ